MCWHLRGWSHKDRGVTFVLPSRPAGVDVWGPHGGHPLFQGGPHLQEVCALQGPRWSQPGPGKVVAFRGTGGNLW